MYYSTHPKLDYLRELRAYRTFLRNLDHITPKFSGFSCSFHIEYLPSWSVISYSFQNHFISVPDPKTVILRVKELQKPGHLPTEAVYLIPPTRVYFGGRQPPSMITNSYIVSLFICIQKWVVHDNHRRCKVEPQKLPIFTNKRVKQTIPQRTINRR